MTPSGKYRLSPHFTLQEFRDWHEGRMPPPHIVAELSHLCRAVLEPLRAKYGTCTVQSGYRTLHTNVGVGGAPHSYHLYDEVKRPAADVTFATGSPREWARAADHLLPAGGLGVYSGHIHVDLRGYRARWTG